MAQNCQFHCSCITAASLFAESFFQYCCWHLKFTVCYFSFIEKNSPELDYRSYRIYFDQSTVSKSRPLEAVENRTVYQVTVIDAPCFPSVQKRRNLAHLISMVPFVFHVEFAIFHLARLIRRQDYRSKLVKQHRTQWLWLRPGPSRSCSSVGS